MGYYIRAIVGTETEMAEVVALSSLDDGTLRTVPLPGPFGLDLWPLDVAFCDAAAIPRFGPSLHQRRRDVPLTPAALLPPSPSVSQLTGALSEAAYVQAEFFGGDGHQAAVMIKAGRLSDDVWRTEGIGAINRALTALGVVKAEGQFDEFDTLGLGLHRRTENWRCRPLKQGGVGSDSRNLSDRQSISDDEDASRVEEARLLFFGEDDASDY